MWNFNHRVLVPSRLIIIKKFILLLIFNKNDYAIALTPVQLEVIQNTKVLHTAVKY